MEKTSISAGLRTRSVETASGGNGSTRKKMCVISYSLTGNNEALAASVARALGADHLRVVEQARRSLATVALDVIFGRTPRVQIARQEIEQYDLVLFVAPIWMGQIATPLRACLRDLQERINSYAFVSICGGADGSNPKIAGELSRRLKRDPVSVLELHIADLLPPEPKPKRKDTMAYQVSESDVGKLTDEVLEIIPKKSSHRSML